MLKKKETSRTVLIIMLILSIIGLMTAAKLTVGQYKSMEGYVDDFCQISDTVDCNAVYQHTEYSMVSFSILDKDYLLPMSYLGILTYFLLTLFFLWGIIINKKYRFATLFGPFLISIISVGLSIYLAYVSKYKIGVFCPYCMVLYGINLILFVMLLIELIRNGKKAITVPFLGIFYFKKKDDYKGYKALQIHLVPIIIIMVVAIFFFTVPVYNYISDYVKETTITPVELSQTESEIDLTNTPSIGNGEINIVIYSDFECPHCKILAEDLHSVLENYQDNITIYYKFLPLDTSCNSFMSRDLHYGACIYAYAAYAAYRQNQFWPFHDQLYARANSLNEELNEWKNRGRNPHNFPGFEQLVFEIAEELNLNLTQFEQDFQSDITREKIEEDIYETHDLGITGTPTVYINGNRLSGSKNADTISDAIDNILETN